MTEFAMYSGFSEKICAEGVEEAAKYARKMGFSAVEFLADFFFGQLNAVPDVEAALEARKVLDKYKLPVACYSVAVNLWNNAEAEKLLMEQIDVAHTLGAPYLHHTLLPWLVLDQDSPSFEDAVRDVVERAVRVADYAKTKGMMCIYEDQGYYVNGVRGFRVFFEEMKKRCDNVGVCGDLGNILFVNERPEEFLREFIRDVRHVHVKDYLRKCGNTSPGRYWSSAKGNCWLRDTMVGSGVVDFETSLRILKEGGYQGRFALENGHPEPYEEGVLQAMELVGKLWETES